jgi:hypothetical protein
MSMMRDGPISMQQAQDPYLEAFDKLMTAPSHGSEVIKEAAGILLVQLCNFMQNFPCPEGIEIFSSHICEEDDITEQVCEPLFYIYNDFALFSLVEVPHGDDRIARVVLRDSTGKYAWDSTISYINSDSDIPQTVNLLQQPILAPSQMDAIRVSQSERPSGTPPAFFDQGAPADQIDDLLQ